MASVWSFRLDGAYGGCTASAVKHLGSQSPIAFPQETVGSEDVMTPRKYCEMLHENVLRVRQVQASTPSMGFHAHEEAYGRLRVLPSPLSQVV